MGWPFGELALIKKLEEERLELENYFGAINEARLIQNTKIPEKPQILIFLEQIQSFRALPFSGGLLDQPYILMMELKQCSDIQSLFDALAAAQQQAMSGGTNA